ncbi:acyl carrier protein [Allocatelliglobosispora scoriae]|uniref:Acyl carrier protein n=1 Tax=Allocatelliglobosispora scoriae TaxID=643052 RepID=A0A841BKN9_9ACTN|nr:phosphopantetheine-binding protein [Allocatelliglobosispora scoriae]MBB5867759.1 acyl carrier protein [Allocatelliglobosispora scoriae]
MSDDQQTQIRTMIRSALAEILYEDLEDIDDDEDFSDLGLDSILGVELVTKINKAYGLTEVIQVLYAKPTVTALTAHLVEQVSASSDTSADEVFATVRRHVLRALPTVDAGAVVPGASLADLGADSLDRADIALGVAEEYGVVVPAEAFAAVTDLRGLADVVRLQRAARVS